MKHSIPKWQFIQILQNHEFHSSPSDVWACPSIELKISVSNDEYPYILIDSDNPWMKMKGVEFKSPKLMDEFIQDQKNRLIKKVIHS